ncbi:unnamed protein product [Ixodes persulcatus]
MADGGRRRLGFTHAGKHGLWEPPSCNRCVYNQWSTVGTPQQGMLAADTVMLRQSILPHAVASGQIGFELWPLANGHSIVKIVLAPKPKPLLVPDDTLTCDLEGLDQIQALDILCLMWTYCTILYYFLSSAQHTARPSHSCSKV